MHYRYTTSGGTETLYAARIDLEEHDGTGWVTTTLVDDIVYAPGGRVRGYVAGEVTMEASWDYAGQLERIHYTKTTGGQSLFDWDITSRDGNGNILELGDTVLAQTYELKYDDRDRLRSSFGTNLKGYQDCSWTYDGAGNRLSEACYCPRDGNGEPNLSSPECKTLTYDYETGTNKLQKIRRTSGYASDCQSGGACTCDPADGYAYNVDAAGRSGTAWKDLRDDADGYDFTYGDFDRIEQVDLDQDGIGDLTYGYDHRGLRLDTADSVHSLESAYALSGEVLQEKSPAESTEYIWNGGFLLAVVRDSGLVEAVGTDMLGSPRRSWSHSDGSERWRVDGESFGKSHSVGVENLGLRFPGQIEDGQTGLHYNWSRFYSPQLGRYLVTDPSGLGAGDLALYPYAHSAVLRLVDPTGRVTVVRGSLSQCEDPNLAEEKLSQAVKLLQDRAKRRPGCRKWFRDRGVDIDDLLSGGTRPPVSFRDPALINADKGQVDGSYDFDGKEIMLSCEPVRSLPDERIDSFLAEALIHELAHYVEDLHDPDEIDDQKIRNHSIEPWRVELLCTDKAPLRR